MTNAIGVSGGFRDLESLWGGNLLVKFSVLGNGGFFGFDNKVIDL